MNCAFRKGRSTPCQQLAQADTCPNSRETEAPEYSRVQGRYAASIQSDEPRTAPTDIGESMGVAKLARPVCHAPGLLIEFIGSSQSNSGGCMTEQARSPGVIVLAVKDKVKVRR
jgi:hypothetical protein